LDDFEDQYALFWLNSTSYFRNMLEIEPKRLSLLSTNRRSQRPFHMTTKIICWLSDTRIQFILPIDSWASCFEKLSIGNLCYEIVLLFVSWFVCVSMSMVSDY